MGNIGPELPLPSFLGLSRFLEVLRLTAAPTLAGLKKERIDLLESFRFKMPLDSRSDGFNPLGATAFSLLIDNSSEEYWFSSSE